MNIAIIGASRDRRKYGNKAVRAYKEAGWHVFPVNPKEREIEGLKTYGSILDVPAVLDRISMYVPPKVAMLILDEIGKKGVKEVYLNPGSESEVLIKELKKRGIRPLMVCSIEAIGAKPSDFTDAP